MDWADFVIVLKEMGPFTAPVCLGMTSVIRWLLTDRKQILQRAVDAEKDATHLREKRTRDLAKQAEEYGQIREAMSSLMREFTAKMSMVLELRQGKPYNRGGPQG